MVDVDGMTPEQAAEVDRGERGDLEGLGPKS